MGVLHLLRVYNLFYFSVLAIFLSFLPLYLAGRGISPAEIGLMVGVGSFIGILSQPFWGMISDKYKTIKTVILLTLGISIVVGSVLFQSAGALRLLILVGLMYFFLLPTDPLTESLNYRISERHGVSFGAIRMFGAIGYAAASLLVGYAVEYLGMGSLSYLFLGFGFLTIVVCLFLPDAPAVAKPISFADLKRFFTYRKTIWFFLLVLIAATPHRTNDNFLGVFIQSLGGSAGMVGQAWFFAAVSEVVFFAWSGRWMRPGTEIKLITLAAAVYAVRYTLCYLVTDPQWVVWLQLLQGITFAVFYSASIQYLYRMIPEEWRATGQTVLAVVFFGISGIVGSLVGGWVFHAFGGSQLYLLMAAVSLASCLFSLALWKDNA
ncbi:MFS transporter [Brevibacillus sp. H7]|jgi:PPP family 3-phenylpropionic acid transporter|uniref:MFS transporter n=1 Tax=Brevibacillus sp. H7 TaxID=3349138 RepID=UPI0038031A02